MNNDVSRENSKRKQYAKLLLKWNKGISLISRKSTGETLERLFKEVETALEMLPTEFNEVVDIGSGNGLPGVLIAIRRPDCRVILIERSIKKCFFLETVARELGLVNLEVRAGGFEEVDLPSGGPTVITSIGLDLYEEVKTLLWPGIDRGDGLFLFVTEGFAEKLATHVSCGTYWWKALPGNKMSGVSLLQK